jgi:rubrerythrin
MADGNVFTVRAAPIELFTGKEAMEKIFLTAMGMEKDSIAFSLGMKEMNPQRSGKERIDGIMKEEMNHIAILSKELTSWKEKRGSRWDHDHRR